MLVHRMDISERQQILMLHDACEEMKRLIIDFKIPEGIVRHYTSFTVAEYILSDNPLLSD